MSGHEEFWIREELDRAVRALVNHYGNEDVRTKEFRIAGKVSAVTQK